MDDWEIKEREAIEASERKVIEVLRRRGGSMPLGELLQALETDSSRLRALANLGLIDIFYSGEVRLRKNYG